MDTSVDAMGKSDVVNKKKSERLPETHSTKRPLQDVSKTVVNLSNVELSGSALSVLVK